MVWNRELSDCKGKKDFLRYLSNLGEEKGSRKDYYDRMY